MFLAARKQMNKQGSVELSSVDDTIARIFEVTGVGDMLTIQ